LALTGTLQAGFTLALQQPQTDWWFEDDFDGTPPTGWSDEWAASSPWDVHDTTDAQGSVSGSYAYRQYFLPDPTRYACTVDTATDIVTATGHGLEEGEPIRFELDGGSFPNTDWGGLNANNYYYARDVTTNTFKVAWSPTGTPHDFTSTGTATWNVYSGYYPGGRKIEFGGDSPIPFIDEGESFSMSYHMKMHPQFDFGNATGHKTIILQSDSEVSDRIYIDLMFDVAAVCFILQIAEGSLYSNTNNVPDEWAGYVRMPKGEWVHFEWYLKVGNAVNNTGVLKGWVDGTLRWDYSNIASIKAGKYKHLSIPLVQTNEVPTGENQERFTDSMKFGPGSILQAKYPGDF